MKFKLILDPRAEESVTVVAHAPSDLTRQIEALTAAAAPGSEGLVGFREEGMRRLPFHEIECITVLDRKVVAIDTTGARYRLGERLRDLEPLLPPCFLRINKSTIANEDRILRFDAAFSGGVDAVFRCGYRDYVSRRCFAEIRRRYEGK